MAPLLTLGLIERELRKRGLDAPRHAVQYVLRTRRIEPISKAGTAYIYPDGTVERVESELKRIERDRSPILARGAV